MTARARLQAVNHVHLDVPVGASPRMREFYHDLLGLPILAALAGENSDLCFGANRLQMRLIVTETSDIRPTRRRLSLDVDSLEEQAAAFDKAEVPYRMYRGLWFTDQRIMVNDPVGHLLELRQSWRL